MENFITHYAAIFAFIHVAAQAIVNLTPTPNPDTLAGKFYTVIELLAGIFVKANVKDTGK